MNGRNRDTATGNKSQRRPRFLHLPCFIRAQIAGSVCQRLRMYIYTYNTYNNLLIQCYCGPLPTVHTLLTSAGDFGSATRGVGK